MVIKKGKRELRDTGTDKRYVKRNPDGTFKESVDVGDRSPQIGVASRRALQSPATVIRAISRALPKSR